jgi:hypothetical protein
VVVSFPPRKSRSRKGWRSYVVGALTIAFLLKVLVGAISIMLVAVYAPLAGVPLSDKDHTILKEWLGVLKHF